MLEENGSVVTKVDVAIVWEVWNQNKERRWCASWPQGLPLCGWEWPDGRLPAPDSQERQKPHYNHKKKKDTKQYLKYFK